MHVAIQAALRGTPEQLAYAAALALDLGAHPEWEVRVTREARRGVVERGELTVRLWARGLDEALHEVRSELERVAAVSGSELPLIEWSRPRRIDLTGRRGLH